MLVVGNIFGKEITRNRCSFLRWNAERFRCTRDLFRAITISLYPAPTRSTPDTMSPLSLICLSFGDDHAKCARHKHFIKNLTRFVFRRKQNSKQILAQAARASWHCEHVHQSTAGHRWVLSLPLPIPWCQCQPELASEDINKESCPLNFRQRSSFSHLGAIPHSRESVDSRRANEAKDVDD